MESSNVIYPEDWPAYRAALGERDPDRVRERLAEGAALMDATLMELEDRLDEHGDVDASLVLEGYKAAGGKH